MFSLSVLTISIKFFDLTISKSRSNVKSGTAFPAEEKYGKKHQKDPDDLDHGHSFGKGNNSDDRSDHQLYRSHYRDLACLRDL